MKTAKVIVVLILAGVILSGFSTEAYAQTICNSGDYCIGTKVQDVPAGCGYNPPGSDPPCYQRWGRVTFTCQADCSYDVYYPAEGCGVDVCSEGAGSWHYTGTCCVNVTGGGDDGGDPPGDPSTCGTICGEGTSTDGCSNVNVAWSDGSICSDAGLSCASWSDWGGGNCKKVCWGPVCGGGGGGEKYRIVGRVYHRDVSTGQNVFWQPSTDDGDSFSCGSEYPTDTNGEHNGTTVVENSNGGNSDWNCNPEPYYNRKAANSGTGPHSFTLTPPPGWECEGWSIGYPLGAPFDPASGLGCTASVPLGDDDWDNHLQWKIKPANDAPTAQITNLSDPVYHPSGSVTVSATASDSNGNLAEVELWRRQYDPDSATWIGSWIQIGTTQSCSGSSCTITRSWDILDSDVGNWWVVANAEDSEGWDGRPYSICTGNPGNNPLTPPIYPASPYADWSNCGDTSRVRVIVNNPPVGTVRLGGDYFSEGTFPSGGTTGVPTGSTQTFQGIGIDEDSNTLLTVRLFRRQFDPSSGAWLGDWIQLGGDHSCGVGTSPCYMVRYWTPGVSDIGSWSLVASVKDEIGDAGGANGRCSGNPGDPATSPYGPLNPPSYPTSAFTGWSNCGNESRMIVNVEPVSDVQGWVWDSTDLVCSYGDKGNNELEPVAVNDVSITTVPTGPTTLSFDGASNYPSYLIEDSPQQNGLSLCVELDEVAQQANATYRLRCVEGPIGSGPLSDTCAIIDVPYDVLGSSVDVHMGFDLDSKGWFTALSGDIYGGCSSCAESVSETLPAPADVQGGFSPSIAAGGAVAFANKEITTNIGPSQYSETSFYLKNINTSETWLPAYDYLPPDNAIQITDCTNFLTNRSLDPDMVYRVSSTCLQTGINNLSGTTYNTVNGKDGAVVVYVTGSDEIVFGLGDAVGNERYFRSDSPVDRILLVSQVPVRISSDLGSSFAGEPTPSTRPFVEASILTQGSIIFESNGDVSTERSVIVEGPLVVGGTGSGTVLLERDRGLRNGWPAEVVVYNPIYLSALTKQEHSSSFANYTGLFVSEVYWEN